MKTRNREDEQQRHAQRDALISEVFYHLIGHENYSFDQAYRFIGRIWGLGDRQIRSILRKKSEVAVVAADLRELAVILYRHLTQIS